MSKKSYLIRKADNLWKEKAIEVHGDKCFVCGGMADQVHHWIKKSQSFATRWDIENAVPICHDCHHIIEHSNDKELMEEAKTKIVNRKGKDWDNKLKKKKRSIFKKNIPNIKEAISKLNNL